MGTQTTKTTLKINGMHCINCEKTIQNILKKLPGIIKIDVSYQKSSADITYNSAITTLESIIATIEKAGYDVNQGEGAAPETITQFLGITVVLLALYLLIQNTVGFNFIPEVNNTMGFGIIFIIGIITSLHCIAMCGGINLSQCIIDKPGQVVKRSDLLQPSILYNMGRVISYTLIGGLAGALGSVISFSDRGKGLIAIIAGVVMVVMGLKMMNIFPFLRRLHIPLPKLSDNFHENVGQFSPLYVGMLNGLMPCGPLQSMQLYALGTGNFISGALSMFFFSLGTVPLMFGLGAASSIMSKRFTQKMLKISAALVIVLGIVMLHRGMNLTGTTVITKVTNDTANVSQVQITDGAQVITTTLSPYYYTPITVKKGVPVKWNIKAERSSLNGCNRSLVIPEYGIKKVLSPGDNIIEFTPTEEGSFVYTCWMGMITSKISVVK